MIDFHCDVLCKLLDDDRLDFAAGSDGLDVTFPRLKAAGSLLQTFAVYIPERQHGGMTPVWRSIDLFYRKVLSIPGIRLIRSAADLEAAGRERQIGALLSLEGVDRLDGDLTLLRILYRLGVRAVGLTWNHANWAADGVMEPRGAGLTGKGKEFVRECERLSIIVDVSHLSEAGFWDVCDLAGRPFIASHSNARSVCDHPRNLTDDQIRAIIAVDGRIGMTFVPWFVRPEAPVTTDDLLRHIEHVCALGGDRHIMLGSDFDGIDRHMEDLRSPEDVWRLKEALLKRYSAEQTERFFSGNALRYLTAMLPAT
ncbi:membrane dipeptidase [Paenibacillus sp. 32O-W]|uniref:dipeptidase n=1 Tax=Paenibacillus sp. 32O-W TaxID=1695218 RepID=UPI00071F9868|nr:dipeptidase [Paenibacillus sp. 32O-W]ALS27628.1 membrane dipeptidase [Paenibacillus sp. 32O-W]